jgi:hypothetical protein
MTHTIHEAPVQEARVDTTPLGPSFELVGRDDIGAADEQAVRRFAIAALARRFRRSFGVAILLASYGVGLLIWHWSMTYQGPGHKFSPATDVLIVAVVLAFGLPEVVLLVRRRRAKARMRVRGVVSS